MAKVANDGFGNVDGQVPHPLQIGVDLDRRHDRAEIDRHRLVQREHPEAASVDFDMQLVDGVVARQHHVDQGRVPVDERLDRRAHAILGKAAHLEKPRFELFELFLKMRNRGCCHVFNQ